MSSLVWCFHKTKLVYSVNNDVWHCSLEVWDISIYSWNQISTWYVFLKEQILSSVSVKKLRCWGATGLKNQKNQRNMNARDVCMFWPYVRGHPGDRWMFWCWLTTRRRHFVVVCSFGQKPPLLNATILHRGQRSEGVWGHLETWHSRCFDSGNSESHNLYRIIIPFIYFLLTYFNIIWFKLFGMP